jgi:hypothetical protein
VAKNYGPALLAAALVAACGDGSECRFGAPGEPISTLTKWSWQDGEVVTTPLVTDLDDDGVADIVLNHARLDGMSLEIGELVALDGATGREMWRVTNEPIKDRHGTAGRATPAIGDVDGDGRPDIVYAGREDSERRSAIHAVDADSLSLWTSHDGKALALTRVASGALVLADLDDDPNLEVIVGGVILDHDGALAWADHRGGVLGSPFKEPNIYDLLYPGGLVTVADLDADGTLELITGREAWKIQLFGGSLINAQVNQLWLAHAATNDGYPAVADLDGNGTPEVVLVAWPELLVVDGATGDLWCGVDSTGKRCEADPTLRTRPIQQNDAGLGGPPTIADFDGDGRLEIGVAGSSHYNLYDLFRDGEDVATHVDDPPAPGELFLRWTAPIFDPSTGSNGALAFDFHGDGAAEVIHQDECFARVLDGRTGEVLGDIRNSSTTVHEYPVVADLDGDRHAELIVAASHRDQFNNCDGAPDEQRQGIFVYASSTQPWAPARPEWTAHATHLGNSFREARAADDDRCGP